MMRTQMQRFVIPHSLIIQVVASLSLFALFLFRALRVLDVEIREAQFSRSEPGRATAIDEREVL